MDEVSVSTVGVKLPAGFEGVAYDAVHLTMKHRRDVNPHLWGQYASAWNAIAYRYKACSESSSAFSEGVRTHGTSPPHIYRYQQERALFFFFSSGLSVWESLCHGLHAIAAFVRPDGFPMTTEAEMRDVTPERTCGRFRAVFPSDQLTLSLNEILSTPQLQEWKEIRNVLVHRTHPGRVIRVGGPNAGETTMESSSWSGTLPINENTTASRFDWLSTELARLLRDAQVFAEGKLP